MTHSALLSALCYNKVNIIILISFTKYIHTQIKQVVCMFLDVSNAQAVFICNRFRLHVQDANLWLLLTYNQFMNLNQQCCAYVETDLSVSRRQPAHFEALVKTHNHSFLKDLMHTRCGITNCMTIPCSGNSVSLHFTHFSLELKTFNFLPRWLSCFYLIDVLSFISPAW